MNGFEVNAEAVMSCGKQIQDLKDKSRELKANCESAEVPDIAWGALGLVTYGYYQQMLSKLSGHLDEIGEGLTSAGEKITQCGESYQDSDRSAEKKLQSILNDLAEVKA